MDEIEVERTGGFAGLRARGTVRLVDLAEADRVRVEALLSGKTKPSKPHPDEFIYRLSAGSLSVEAPERDVPQAIRAVVRNLPR